MLLNFAKKLRTQALQGANQTGNPTIGALTVITQYDQPRYGDLEGVGVVQIDFTGNMQGYSPVERCQDSTGEITWVPTELIRNIRSTPFSVHPTAAVTRQATLPGAVRRRRSRRRQPAAAQQAVAK